MVPTMYLTLDFLLLMISTLTHSGTGATGTPAARIGLSVSR